MNRTKIAVVEAQGGIRDRFGHFLESAAHQVDHIVPSDDLAKRIALSECDLVIAAEETGGLRAVDLMTRLRDQNVETPVIIIAHQADVRSAVDAIRAGAVDLVPLTEGKEALKEIISNQLNKKVNIKSNCEGEHKKIEMVAGAGNMQRLLDMVERIAPSSATVLIQGESGTGKEVMAKYIHRNSGRAELPFIAMNCAALPENLAESELFGYEKGAFTGATGQKRGKFELARGGTLLLDEISEMALPLQAKLLRVLQEKEVDRIGGSGAVSVDVRVIATTNRDLAEMVKAGQFRKDLYYRLRIIPLTIPPLRERCSDIAELIDHFIIKYSRGNENELPRFSRAAMEVMTDWNWPGNVRELENTVERAMLLRSGNVMGPELLLLEEELSSGPDESTAVLVGMTVKDLEERLILQTLNHVNQNRTHAAEMLGISIRTLRNKLKDYREANGPSCDAAGRC